MVTNRIASRIVIGLVLSLVASALSYIVLQWQLYAAVKCDNVHVASLIYNASSNISAITDIEEVSYSQQQGSRTCSGVATTDGRRRKMIFVIDTSHRGQPVDSRPNDQEYRKFSVSYRFSD